jgi:tetratricopeptide (TPR) repeat protein
MPSLKQLEDFKTSFQGIGAEAAVLAERQLPPDDLVLPDTEAVPGTDASGEGPGAETGPDLFFDTPLPPEEAGMPDDAGDFDFSAFLDTIPDDIPAPGASDSTAGTPDAFGMPGESGSEAPDAFGMPEESGFEAPETPAADQPAEDFNFPDNLLDGFADEVEAERAGGGSETPETALPAEEDGGFDFSFPDIDGPDMPLSGGDEGGEEAAFPDDAPPQDIGVSDIPEDEAFSLFSEEPNLSGSGGTASAEGPEEDLTELAGPEAFEGDSEASGGQVSLEDSGFPDTDFSIPEEALDMGSETGGDGGLEEAESPESSGDGFGDMDFSIPEEALDMGNETGGDGGLEEAESPESSGDGFGDADFSIPDGAFDIGIEPGGLGVPDSFDAFNLDGETFGADFPLPGEKPGAGVLADMEDFSLAGIDESFGASPAAGRAQGQAPAEVEEINLSEDEVNQIQQTLSSYPLNLRIACEELIAEQAVAPDLMSSLVKFLVRGAPAKEAASLAGKILGRTIPIPKGFEKKTGEELEAEQASFAYIFVHNFLPVLRIFLAVSLAAVSLLYLIFRFIYTPLRANSIYQAGYERIETGEYARANDRFREASRVHRIKKWFYRYAEAFRDARQYIYAEEKYDELLLYYPRDKQGALDYAGLETNYLRNFAKADSILRRNILDYAVNDKEGLLALGDNNLAWGEIERSRYEDAREAYAKLLEQYGWEDPIVERMLLYFIRTDNLGETLPLQQYFMDNPKSKITAPTLAELGGYLLDKQSEVVRGVPDEHIGRIDGIRNILFRAIRLDPALPESHYHLARYYNNFGNTAVERQTLETAIEAFDAARTESARRTAYRLDAEYRYAQILIGAREFFAAEEELVKGIGIYEDALDRRLLFRSPEFGRLYAGLGDLEYFTKDGNMETAIRYYLRSEQNGWAPPEVQYRIGSSYYHLRQWGAALDRFLRASAVIPLNRRILHALGNTSYMRGDYFIAQGYYHRLLDLLEAERERFPMLMPNDRPEHMELAERLMVSRNNLGVTLEALAENTGDLRYRSRALALYAESARAWDSLTRNPDTMIRMRPTDLYSPGINLGFLNSQNSLHPVPGYEPQIFIHIDKDVLEPSDWEDLAPPEYRLSS